MPKRKGFPEEGEDVIVTVIDINPHSALCKLEEYPGKEGMIHISEVTGKWVKDIRKFIKMNKQYAAKVLKVDEEKGHINLSLKRLSKKAKERKIQDFKKEQKAEKLLEMIAKKKEITLDKAYEEIGYDLQDTFGDMFIAFDNALKSPDTLIRRGIPKEWADIIHEVAKENIVKKNVKIKAEIDLYFYSGNGVERVKEFFSELINKYNLNVKYISAPRYSIEITTSDPKKTEKHLQEILERETTKIKGGTADFKIIGGKT